MKWKSEGDKERGKFCKGKIILKLFSLNGSSFCRRVRKLHEVKRSYEKPTNFVSFLVTKPPKKRKQNKIGIKKT